MKNRIFLFFLLLNATEFCYSQPFYFRHYQVENGLANNTVFSIIQDQKGFMWFGTKEGLNRFDGSTFKPYNMILNDAHDLKEFIYCLATGIKGSLWVGTRKGLFEFNEEEETFSLLKATGNTEILDIISHPDGKVWFTSDSHLYCFDENKNKLRGYDFFENGKLKINAICASPNGSLWASSFEGYLFRYDPSSDAFVCINKTLKPGETRLNDITKMYYSENAGLFIGSVTGLFLFDPDKNSYTQLLKVNSRRAPLYVRDILQYSDNEFWIATESGMYIYNAKTRTTVNLLKQNSDPYSLSDNAVYSLYKDSENSIWTGTYFGGINYFNKQLTNFKKYYPNSYENKISGNGVRELCDDGFGNLWIGTEDAGLNKLDKRTGNITTFNQKPDWPGLSSNNIHGLLVDGNELWVGTFQKGLDILDIKTGKVLRHYSADSSGNGLKSNFIITFCKTINNEILIGTSGGLYRYNRMTKNFSLVKEIPENSFVFSLFEDKAGTVWIGTIGDGVYYINAENKSVGNLRYDPKNTNSLSNNSVCGIFQDSESNLWFATEGGGLCKLSDDRKVFTRFSTDNGLPSNMVYKVLEDKENNLWISTSKGLVFYNPRKPDWKVYTKEHGLLTDQFNYNSAYADSDGTMYFGSVKGLMSFKPGNIISDTSFSPVYITSFQVNNEELIINKSSLKKSISFTDTIVLRYDQSTFSIGFSALTYIAPEMTQYAYKLDGLDKEWTYLAANRKVYFTNLSAGNYTFRVKTANGNGTWNTKETILFIKIRPPFWLSPAAYFFYFIAGLFIVYLVVSGYHKKLKQKNERKQQLFEQQKEKEIYSAKIEFFTNVAHEIRTPLTLIKGPLERVIDEVGEDPKLKKSLKNIEKNTERLLLLTKQLLDFRKIENKGFSLSFVKDNISEKLKSSFLLFAPVAEQNNLKFEIELPEEDLYAFIDVEAFNKILNNLISNAIKYAGSEVMIGLLPVKSSANGIFIIEIRNDGFLIPVSLRKKIFEPFYRIPETEKQSGSGIGLSIAKSLAELHNGTLELKPSVEGANVFRVTLPIHQAIEFDL